RRAPPGALSHDPSRHRQQPVPPRHLGILRVPLDTQVPPPQLEARDSGEATGEQGRREPGSSSRPGLTWDARDLTNRAWVAWPEEPHAGWTRQSPCRRLPHAPPPFRLVDGRDIVHRIERPGRLAGGWE